MKRSLPLVLCLCVLLFTAGCGKQAVNAIDFTAQEVQSLTIFSYTVPIDAQKKEITDPRYIQRAVDVFSSLKSSGNASAGDVRAGSSNCIFVFHLSGGRNFSASYDGTILTFADQSLLVRDDALYSLWDFPSPAEKAYQEEFPSFGR